MRVRTQVVPSVTEVYCVLATPSGSWGKTPSAAQARAHPGEACAGRGGFLLWVSLPEVVTLRQKLGYFFFSFLILL